MRLDSARFLYRWRKRQPWRWQRPLRHPDGGRQLLSQIPVLVQQFGMPVTGEAPFYGKPSSEDFPPLLAGPMGDVHYPQVRSLGFLSMLEAAVAAPVHPALQMTAAFRTTEQVLSARPGSNYYSRRYDWRLL